MGPLRQRTQGPVTDRFMERLGQLQQLQEDLLDISLVAGRILTTGEHRRALDEVLSQFGYTREQLRELPE